MGMATLSNHTRERMAAALVLHRFRAEGDKLCAEAQSLRAAIMADAYPAETLKLMAKIQKAHRGAFDTTTYCTVKVGGMRINLSNRFGAEGCWFTPKLPPLSKLQRDRTDDDYADHPLADRIRDYAVATKSFSERATEARREALGALAQFTTDKRLIEGWPEAMPVIGELIPEERRTLPTVQVKAINDKFGLPPAEAA